MALTLIETIPGALVPVAGAKTLEDLPFNRANLLLWLSAQQVATSPFTASGTPDGTTAIDSFSDMQVPGQGYPAYVSQSYSLIDVNGIPVARARLTESATRRGNVLPVGVIQNKPGLTIFAIFRLTAAPNAIRSIIGSTTGSSSSAVAFDFGTSVTGRPQIVTRRGSMTDAAASVALPTPAPVGAFIGVIATVDFANNVISIESVHAVPSGDNAASVSGAITGSGNSTAFTSQALGLGYRLGSGTPTTGSWSFDNNKFAGDIEEAGIFGVAIDDEVRVDLRNHIRAMVKALNG